MGLPAGARLHLGSTAVVEVVLRNPCVQLDRFADGLIRATLRTGPDGTLHRLAGVMSVVRDGGDGRVGDAVRVHHPGGAPVALRPV